ncbi:hypothetical protein D3C76_1799920 [compost metagenome]
MIVTGCLSENLIQLAIKILHMRIQFGLGTQLQVAPGPELGASQHFIDRRNPLQNIIAFGIDALANTHH